MPHETFGGLVLVFQDQEILQASKEICFVPENVGSCIVLRIYSGQSFGHGFQVKRATETTYFLVSVRTNLQESKQYLSILLQVRSPSTIHKLVYFVAQIS
jgi:hypothetical protein